MQARKTALDQAAQQRQADEAAVRALAERGVWLIRSFKVIL